MVETVEGEARGITWKLKKNSLYIRMNLILGKKWNVWITLLKLFENYLIKKKHFIDLIAKKY